MGLEDSKNDCPNQSDYQNEYCGGKNITLDLIKGDEVVVVRHHHGCRFRKRMPEPDPEILEDEEELPSLNLVQPGSMIKRFRRLITLNVRL